MIKIVIGYLVISACIVQYLQYRNDVYEASTKHMSLQEYRTVFKGE